MKTDGPRCACPIPMAGCTRPYHDTADINGGDPHAEANAEADMDGGKMDGLSASAIAGASCQISSTTRPVPIPAPPT